MKSTAKKAFVFVLCGTKEHTETLALSYKALRNYTSHEIFIVTDTKRNEVRLEYPNVFDVNTPVTFDNHQASIYLKTSLHKYLPDEYLYCYLDTDVVALNSLVDTIFDNYTAPILFATDHCRINSFSPSAVNCICKKQYEQDNNTLYATLNYFDNELLPKYNYIDKCRIDIDRLVAESKGSTLKHLFHVLKYYMPGRFYRLSPKYKLDKATGRWYDKDDTMLWYEHKDNIRFAEEQTGFICNRESLHWQRPDGSSLSLLTCNHLKDAIKIKTEIDILPLNWQHWNGGVFLFDKQSHGFLNDWHELTMNVFTDNYWRTRDQGTLAATVWKHKLQGNRTLPIQFNFIADYNNGANVYAGELSFKLDSNPTAISPLFIHIYHHWGDDSWAVWRDVKKHVMSSNA